MFEQTEAKRKTEHEEECKVVVAMLEAKIEKQIKVLVSNNKIELSTGRV